MKEGEDRLLYLKITRERFIQAINRDNDNLNRLMTATQIQPQSNRSNTNQPQELAKAKLPSSSAVAVMRLGRQKSQSIQNTIPLHEKFGAITFFKFF